MIRAILTDIEGTTSSISFVHEVLFPYAYNKMGDFLRENWNEPLVQKAVIQVAELENLSDYNPEVITSILRAWIKEDRKITPLKDLQGMIWEEGYNNGDFQSHVYQDAYEKLTQWHQENIPLYVYSSGSVQAQKLFFSHTTFGDLLYLFSGFFDTNIGSKKETKSYQRIAESLQIPPQQIIFLSDVLAEVDSASAAGMQTVWVIRDSSTFSQHQSTSSRHQVVPDFYHISLPLPS
ncbi:MAG: acireductone synthase [Geminocystis sp.]|nr:acireductone synthase [Geminocystis sp.]HIK37752.1 acireductone synthase [Geminocystis sp. M7585_C2015_104]MCS7148939.1 acireductone synthase [Geminocystis sp.]MCX8077438.1 acireductone synthase [Geminocystis sp.]MDW8117214.1 acireductone synthase [Geminocystis sp.]